MFFVPGRSPTLREAKRKTANSNVKQSAKVLQFPSRKDGWDGKIAREGKLIEFPTRKVKETEQRQASNGSLKMAA